MPLRTVGKMGSDIGPALSGGSPTQTSRPPRRREANACSKTGGRDHREHHGDVGATERLDRHHRIDESGVDAAVGSEPPAELELGLVDVDGDHRGAHQSGVLDREVAEPADPEDRHPLAGDDAGDLDGLVRRHAGGL